MEEEKPTESVLNVLENTAKIEKPKTKPGWYVWGKWIVVALFILILIIVFVNVLRKPKLKNEVATRPAIADTSQDNNQSQETAWPSATAKYITAVPLDLTQIKSISKYRSCSGHDFSGYSFEKTLETNRSMKHYILPVETYQGTLDKVKMFAPFDGAVSAITLESDEIGKPGKRPQTGNGITFSTTADKNVGFQFAHIYFVKEFKVGDKVKAGDLIGYAALGDKGNDFDIVLSGIKQTTQPIFGSAFDHMNTKVLAEFAKYGVTPDNTKITKEYRNAHPCDFNANQAQGRDDENWIQLKH